MKGYVLEEDINRAKELYNNCYRCLKRAELWLMLDCEDYAEQWLDRFKREKAELLYLRQKKLNNDDRKRRLSKTATCSLLHHNMKIINNFTK